MKTFGILLLAAVSFVGFTAMRPAPKPKASPVSPFDVKEYTGKWYEIARLDHTFEKNLSNVTATYTLDEDGKIKVVNRGFDEKKKKWKDADGKAKKAGEVNEGRLKVCFGLCWSQYNVIALDKNYRHALVAGKNTKYLWILSRDKILPESVRKNFIDCANDAGYNTDELIWVAHDKD
jgi:apolipoprotein D and lipocalin family protein